MYASVYYQQCHWLGHKYTFYVMKSVCHLVRRFLTLWSAAVTWCVMSDAEEQKCLDLAGNATLHQVRGTLLCTRGLHSRDCMEKIKVQ